MQLRQVITRRWCGRTRNRLVVVWRRPVSMTIWYANTALQATPLGKHLIRPVSFLSQKLLGYQSVPISDRVSYNNMGNVIVRADKVLIICAFNSFTSSNFFSATIITIVTSIVQTTTVA